MNVDHRRAYRIFNMHMVAWRMLMHNLRAEADSFLDATWDPKSRDKTF